MSDFKTFTIAGSTPCGKCDHTFYRHLEDSTNLTVGTKMSDLECSVGDCGCMGYLNKTPTVSREDLDALATYPKLPLKSLGLAPEAVVHPTHYNSGKIEVWDFIIDQDLPYCLGDAVKYICRTGKKDSSKRVQDLEKAKQYIDREIRRIKEEEAGIIIEDNKKAIDEELARDWGHK